MSAAFQARITVTGNAKVLEAFKQQIDALLAEENTIENLGTQYFSGGLIYRFEVTQGIPFPPFVLASAAFPDLKIQVEWINPRDETSGSALIQNGMLIEHHTRALTVREAADQILHDIEIGENGYLKLAIVCKNTGTGEYAGYLLSGKQQALFKIKQRGRSAELYASDGFEAHWAEHWIYNLESKQKNYQELTEKENLPEKLAHDLEALVNDFLDEWVWFAESAPEAIAVERQRYERMGLTPHLANIKAGKIIKMEKREMPQGNFFVHGTLLPNHAWIKNVIAACWSEN
jgi:hypothetical protein